MNKTLNPLIHVLEKKANAFDTIKNTAKRIPNDQDLGAWVKEFLLSHKIDEEKRNDNRSILHD